MMGLSLVVVLVFISECDGNFLGLFEPQIFNT